MRYLSTRGGASPVGPAEAILSGLASDGGLWIPESLPRLESGFAARMASAGIAVGGAEMLAPLLDPDIDRSDLEELLAEALDFPIPLRPLDEHTWLLELHHGPTLAFKDVAARTMARLLGRFSGGDPLTVLVATSGDTGSAVAHAFHGVANTRVVVLYPLGRVSDLQERQMATLGENVEAFAVDGSFDDCQALVKAAFGDADLRQRHRLSSANSINIGRLLPQMLYHAWALATLPAEEAPVVVVPSGNFGNLTAGLYAERVGGFAVNRWIAAVNANRVVPDYLASGEYRPQPSVATLSNAMDVGAPSNMSRIQSLFEGDVSAIRERIGSSSHDDDATLEIIGRVLKRSGLLLDPHTAVGYAALEQTRLEQPTTPAILIATAHPAKFGREIETVAPKIELPNRLASLLDRPLTRRTMPARSEALAAVLDG